MEFGARLSLTAADWAICAGLLVFSIAFGLFISARMRSSADSGAFFLAGRKLAWPIIGASLFATNIGAEHLVGLSGDTYRYGISAATVEFTTAMCLGIACAILLPAYFKNNVFTIPEFLELRYNRASRTFFSGLMLLISIMTKTAFCLFAGALVLNSLAGWGVMKSVIGLAVICAITTILGGFAAVAYTDSIQTVIMVVGSGLGFLIGLGKVGGWSGLAARVPEMIHMHRPLADPNFPFWGVILGALYGGIFYWGMDQVNVQRLLGAPSLREARRGAMFAVLLKLLPVFIFAMPGLICLALFPGRDPRTTFVTFLNDVLPAGLRGMVLAALLAALISSLLAVMNSISTLTVKDFILRARPRTSEKAQVALGRAAIAVAALLGVGAAYLVYKNQEGLYKYLQAISIFLVMPLTPAIFFGVTSRRVTVAGAISSFAAGFAVAALYVTDQIIVMIRGPEAAAAAFPFLHKTLTRNYTWRGLWGTLLVTAVLFGVSAFTRKSSSEKLARTTMKWKGRGEPFEGWGDWRLHLGILGLITILLYWFMW
jgi:solute:Na+ symporter, SSS family